MEIYLKDLEFHAHHGVFEQEQAIGNKYLVNLTVNITSNRKMRDDNLSATVSYADLYDIIKKWVNIPHKLLESLAIDISCEIKMRFPNIESGWISIEKSRPPISGMIGSAGVKYFF